jgi:DNA polymerase-4
MLTTLFLDLNSYFASVEQQVQPSLRGKPVAVAPITSDSGCCIAASYEAKRHGVKTGTRVGEARRLCPDIAIVDARPRLYVLMHHRVLKAVDRHIPVHKVHSIDEVSCRLDRTQRSEGRARALAVAIKRSIRETCGACMRCSIGIAPNRVLAKLGTDMQKPDGLVVLTRETLAETIGPRSPQDLSGIGPKMMKRLEMRGFSTINDLLKLSEDDMRRVWGGVVGARWWHWLRGYEVEEAPTHKGSIGHQHVLAPSLRNAESARGVAFRLLLKAAARLRHDNYAARKLTLGLRFPGDPANSAWGGTSWDATTALGEGCVDTPTMLDALGELWKQAPSEPPLQVGVTLHDLVAPQSQTLPLFKDERRREGLSRAMDKVNQKFGANTVYTANMQDARGHGTGGIAFNYVPNLDIADSVQSRQRGDERAPAGGAAPPRGTSPRAGDALNGPATPAPIWGGHEPGTGGVPVRGAPLPKRPSRSAGPHARKFLSDEEMERMIEGSLS